jgi:hypothetical protein
MKPDPAVLFYIDRKWTYTRSDFWQDGGMSSELMKSLVNLEDEKHIKDGFTRKLAVALIHDLEAAVGVTSPADPGELVLLHHLASPPAPRPLTETL